MKSKLIGYMIIGSVTLSLIFLGWTTLSVANTPQATSAPLIQPTPSSRKTLVGSNLPDCIKKLVKGGWCEVVATDKHRSISSVWPKNISARLRMRTGPSAILRAWNGAAFDEKSVTMYFTGGGHADYGGNEVYQFDLINGQWSRLTDPSTLNRLFVLRDYNKSIKKPWRRLCWRGQQPNIPGSSHSYDGIIFSNRTQTILSLSGGAANGSCFGDKKDKFKNSELVSTGPEGRGRGLYEFNPSMNEIRNNLAPLSWRLVLTNKEMTAARIAPSYPRTAELSDGRLIIGTSNKTMMYDPKKPTVTGKKYFNTQADFGDGFMMYHPQNNLLWSLHRNSLLAFNAKTGQSVHRINSKIPHGKTIAIDQSGKIFSWNGVGTISILDPKHINSGWQVIDWQQYGPQQGSNRVYSKWVYLKQYDVFAGISSHKTGFWIYKHPKDDAMLPKNVTAIRYNNQDLRKTIKNATPGSHLVIPPGVYGQGLFINKSISLDLTGVSLRGISQSRAIINIKCNDCEVTINNFNAYGPDANCTNGNCAGIKITGINPRLRLTNSHINNTAMGILTDNRGGGVIIDNTVIENTGLGNKSRQLGHGFYAGAIDSVIFRNSTIKSAFNNGHLFKSRAHSTVIENSNLLGLNGRYSRLIDFPCGGILTIKNSTLHHGKQTDNSDLFSVGTEPKHCKQGIPASTVIMKNNWIIIDRDRSDDERGKERGTSRLFTWYAPIEKLMISDNKIVEKTGNLKMDAKGLITGLANKNSFYLDRKSAGLKAGEIPLR